MIGVRLTSREPDGGTWVVAAADGGRWIVTREDTFASPEALTTEDIAERFTVDGNLTDPSQPSEAEGWERLADANDRAALRLAVATNPEDLEPDEEDTDAHDRWRRAVRAARGSVEPTPEQRFAQISDADAQRLGHRR